MNHAKYQQLVSGQTSIAQKVLTVVPLATEWDSRQIRSELLRVTRSAPDLRIVEGCLRKLVEAGLVKELAREMYRRTPVPPAPVPTAPVQPIEAEEETLVPIKEPAAPSAFDRLAAVAASLRNAGATLTKAAAEIEDIALQAQQQIEDERNKAGKYRQLGSLLKELGVAE